MNISGTTIEQNDFDKDGFDEIIVQNDNYTSVFKPNDGGMMVELSLNRHNFSLTDTLMRRIEGYHQKLDHAVTPDKADNTASIHDLVLTKEEGLKDLLIVDKYLKRCFIDHIFEDDIEFEKFQSGDCKESLFDKTYEAKTESDEVTFLYNCKTVPVKISKQFTFKNNSIAVEYQLSTTDNSEIEINFGIENNFNFQAGHADDRFILIDGKRHENSYLDSTGSYDSVSNFCMVDGWRNIAVALISDSKSDLWHLPIHTVSLSEGGFEKVYQGTTFVNSFRLKLTEKSKILKFTLHTGVEEDILKTLPACEKINR